MFSLHQEINSNVYSLFFLISLRKQMIVTGQQLLSSVDLSPDLTIRLLWENTYLKKID